MKILLVEDEIQLNKALSAVLKRNSYSVDSVYNGQDALDYISYSSYNLIILDIMLPKVDGLTVLKTVRQKKDNTPIMLLTAKSDIDDRIRGLDCGADDYLCKPFNVDELLARVRALLRRKPDYDDNELRLGNTTLNTLINELSTDKGKVTLGNKEQQILVLLLKKTNMIVSLDTIINEAWSVDEYSTSENVWVFISYLRKKLSQIESNIEIKSMRNQGYRLGIKND